MQCLYSQPLHSDRHTHRLTVACNVYTANHYTHTDRHTDWQWHAMFKYSQPLHWHRHTHRLTEACKVYTANHYIQTDMHRDIQMDTQTDTQTDVAVCESTCSQKLSMIEHSDHMDAWQLCATARLGSAPTHPPQYICLLHQIRCRFDKSPLDETINQNIWCVCTCYAKRSHTHIKDLVVHVRVWWTTVTPK